MIMAREFLYYKNRLNLTNTEFTSPAASMVWDGDLNLAVA